MQLFNILILTFTAIYYLYLLAYKFNDDEFYNEVKNKILPYYKYINKVDISKDIKLDLIKYLENKRRYKQANRLYRELLS